MQKPVSPIISSPRKLARGGGAWVLALAAYLVVLPVAPASAGSESARPRASRIAAASDSATPTLDLSRARFRRLGPKHQIKGNGGLKVTTSLGRWSAGDAHARGATVAIRSPWGEELNVALVLSESAIHAELNGRIQVLTTLGPDGAWQDLQVTADGTTTTSHLGDAGRRFASGAPLPADLDLSAHQALAAALQNELSPAFLAELTNIDRPAVEVGCYWQLAGCVAAIAAWVIDVAALPAACVLAGVPTFGVSCALAVIGHQLASAGVVTSCTQYSNCRNYENTPPQEPDESTPIIIDMDGRGFRLTGLENPVVFDLNADGIPDRVSWTSRGGDEAFLVMDRNRNGRIDDGSELFGSHTPLVDGSFAEHGFIPLSEYDLPAFGGNQNGQLDPGDRIFGRLMLWNDRDRDGVSHARELRGLRGAGVIALSLDYKIDGRADRHGNKFVVNGKAFVRVRGQQQTRVMSDVYLRIQQ